VLGEGWGWRWTRKGGELKEGEGMGSDGRRVSVRFSFLTGRSKGSGVRGKTSASLDQSVA